MEKWSRCFSNRKSTIMHNTAYDNAVKFYEKYCVENIENKVVIDIGSMDINGTLKPIFNQAKAYIGIDQFPGKNVDIISSSHKINLENDYADIVVTSSCFEHDDMFWISFLEICRIVKPNGHFYINAPSNGPYHAHPVDNWRFYEDSWKALEKWGLYNHFSIKLIESYIDQNKSSCDYWNDSVGIYQKISN